MPTKRQIRTKPTRVPRCPIDSKHRPGCPPCMAWSAYDQRLRRWEIQEGISRANVPVNSIREHLRFLVDHGNYKLVDITRISGIPKATLGSVLNGRRVHVFQITADTILAIKPREQISPPKRGMVPAVEGVRILRGLSAQGWTFPFIGELMGNSTRTAVQKLAGYALDGWMFPETLDRIRVVADKLGQYSIADLDRPMEGMDIRCANYAVRRGWVPLRDWNEFELADPDAEPFRAEPPADQEVVANLFIDYTVLRLRIAEAVDKDYVAPLTAITRLEAYVGTVLSQEAGLSAVRTGAILGYSQRTAKERETGQRQVTRLRAHLTSARQWLDSEPDGETPPWLEVAVGNDFHRFLPALMAVLPAPFGRALSVEELTERCGADTTLAQVREFLARAAQVADRPWEARAPRGKAAPRPTTTAGRAARTRERLAA